MPYTDAPLQELKSISSPDQRRAPGRAQEDFVAATLIQSGWTLVMRNQKICGVEVDLVVSRKNALGEKQFSLVEVKSLSRESHWATRLSYGQKKRLLRAQQYYCLKKNCPVQLVLAFVYGDRKLQFIPITPDFHP